MNKRSRKEFFDEHGYFIEKNAFNTGDMESLFEVFYDLSWNVAIRNKIDLSKKILPTNKIQYPRDLKQLDHLMLDIFNYNKDLLGEIYDTFSYSSAFMRFLGNEKVESMAKELLGLPNYTTLYGWTNRVRIDPPRDERRTYGWHQEIFYTFPKTRFVQTWCPILRDTTIDNGTIEIKPYSHKEGIPKQTWTEEEGKAPQIIIDKSNRIYAGPSVPAHGLFLTKVEYPKNILSETTFIGINSAEQFLIPEHTRIKLTKKHQIPIA